MPDATHAAPPAPDEHADPTAATTFVVGAVSVILLIVTVIGLEVLYYRTVEQENFRKVISQQPEELRRVQAEQLEVLHGYRWVDRDKGVVAIPIERAMQLSVDEAKRARGETGGGTRP